MRNIAGALLYLRVTTWRNLILARVLRLRQPKYFVGGLIGVAYIYFVFLRRFTASRVTAPGLPDNLSPDLLPLVVTSGSMMLLLFFALCWLWPRERASLHFSEAEIAFLFPAPLTRKMLIHFRLLSSLLGVLFTSLIMAVVSSRWGFLSGSLAVRIMGWWIIIAAISLHITGSAFAITQLMDRGLTQLRRQLLVFGAIAVVIGITYLTSWRHWPVPEPAQLDDFPAIARYFAAPLDSGMIGYLLLPLKWLVRPMLAADLRDFLLVLGPAVVVLAAHYLWVLYSETAFEEASIASAQKRTARLAAIRSGNMRLGRSVPKPRRPPFNVLTTPRPELAFLWKNILSSASYLRPRTAIVTAILIVAGSQWLKYSDFAPMRTVIGSLSFAIAGYVLVFGAMIARQDLRSDLMNIDILKTYPLRGWQIVLGEILTPVAIITVLLWLLLLVVALNFEPQDVRWAAYGSHLWLVVALALIIPLLCMIEVLVLNAAALLFPAWVQTGTPSRGIDALGQRILFFAAMLLTIVIVILPASLAAVVIFFSIGSFTGLPVAAALGFAAAVGILSAEIVIAIRWLGKRFENFDLSEELRH